MLSDAQGLMDRPLPPLMDCKSRMPLRVAAHRDEHAYSYLARLAIAAGHRSIDAFLARSFPWPLKKDDVANGRECALVARFASLPEDVFAQATPTREKNDQWRVQGDVLSPVNGFATTFRFCPACFDEDLDAGHSAAHRGSVEPHLRGLWAHPLVTACPRHLTALEPLDQPVEFIVRWGQEDWRFAVFRKRRPRASIGDLLLSCFLAGRLGYYEPLPEPPELAPLPLDAALDVMRAVGALMLKPSRSREGNDATAPEDALKHGIDWVIAQRRPFGEVLQCLATGPANERLKTPLQAFGDILAIAKRADADERFLPLEMAIAEAALRFTNADFSDPLFRNAKGDGKTLFNRSELSGRFGIGRDRFEALIRSHNDSDSGTYAIHADAKIITAEQAGRLAHLLEKLITTAEAQAETGLGPEEFKRFDETGWLPKTEGTARPYRRDDIQRIAAHLCDGLPEIDHPPRGDTVLRYILALSDRGQALSFLNKLKAQPDEIRRIGVLRTPEYEGPPRIGDLVVRADDAFGRTKPEPIADRQPLLRGHADIAAYIGCDRQVLLKVLPYLDANFLSENHRASAGPKGVPHARIVAMDAFLTQNVLLQELVERLGRCPDDLFDELMQQGVLPTYSVVDRVGIQGGAAFFPREGAEALFALRQELAGASPQFLLTETHGAPTGISATERNEGDIGPLFSFRPTDGGR